MSGGYVTQSKGAKEKIPRQHHECHKQERISDGLQMKRGGNETNTGGTGSFNHPSPINPPKIFGRENWDPHTLDPPSYRMVEIARWKLQSLGYPRAKDMKLGEWAPAASAAPQPSAYNLLA